MKKLIAIVVLMSSLSACASLPEAPPIDLADIMKSAQCIEQGIYCTRMGIALVEAKDWEVIEQAYDNFAKCVKQLADMGCGEQAKELRDKFKEAKAKASE